MLSQVTDRQLGAKHQLPVPPLHTDTCFISQSVRSGLLAIWVYTPTLHVICRYGRTSNIRYQCVSADHADIVKGTDCHAPDAGGRDGAAILVVLSGYLISQLQSVLNISSDLPLRSGDHITDALISLHSL